MGRRPALALPLLAVVALAVFPALAGATADQRDTSLFIPVIGNIVTAEDVDVDIGQPVDITRTFSSGVPYIALWMNMLGTYEGASLFVKVTHLDSQDALSDTWDFEMKGYESDVGWVFLEPGEGESGLFYRRMARRMVPYHCSLRLPGNVRSILLRGPVDARLHVDSGCPLALAGGRISSPAGANPGPPAGLPDCRL